MNKHVKVIPISKKAKNRFANLMGSVPVCIVEQEKNNQLFLASANKKYFFWVNELNDSDWEIVRLKK